MNAEITMIGVTVACVTTALILVIMRKRIKKRISDRIAGTDTGLFEEKKENEIEHDIKVAMEAILK